MTTIDIQPTVHAGHGPRASMKELAQTARDGLVALMITALEWQYRARERRQLLGLPDGALRDFGASRADAENEGAKPFWKR